MKIVFVAPWIPSEERPRSLRIIEQLMAEHEVHFVGLARSRKDESLASNLRCSSITVVRENRFLPLWRSLVALISGKSLQEAYGSSLRLRRKVIETASSRRAQVVHLNVFRSVSLIPYVSEYKLVIDLDELRSHYYAQLQSSSSLFYRLLGRVEAGRMFRREAELLKSDVLILFSSPADLSEDRPASFLVRSSAPLNVPERGNSTKRTILFVGRLSYEANVDGLRWFYTECWPALSERHSELELCIVGADPPASVRAMRSERVEVFSNVASVGAYYDSAAIAIVPIFRGTGVQMKLIQSLMSSVPTVTSDLVARLAGVSDGEQVLTGDSSGDWVQAIDSLILDRAFADRIANAGYRWACEHHAFRATQEQLKSVYAHLSREDQVE